jgi:hypothetical protein
MFLINWLIFLLLLPLVRADAWDDFSNNLATDLAPLIALFGEETTKQYLSESLGWLDNFIFALVPLGIITAVVSAIRVCGSPSLRAFIGRAQEGGGVAEAELCSSTSRDVCELWSSGGIARVFGRPRILELVHDLAFEAEEDARGLNKDGYEKTEGLYLPKDYFPKVSKTTVPDRSTWDQVDEPTELPRNGAIGKRRSDQLNNEDNIAMGVVGADQIESKIEGAEVVGIGSVEQSPKQRGSGKVLPVRQGYWVEEQVKARRSQQSPPDTSVRHSGSSDVEAAEVAEYHGFAPNPNLSLNIGITRPSPFMVTAVAIFGFLLQSAVLVFAAWATYIGRLLKNGQPVPPWAFPLALIGTVFICIGMFLCAFIIERITAERAFKWKG